MFGMCVTIQKNKKSKKNGCMLANPFVRACILTFCVSIPHRKLSISFRNLCPGSHSAVKTARH